MVMFPAHTLPTTQPAHSDSLHTLATENYGTKPISPIESTKVSVCEPVGHTPSRSAASPQNYGTKPIGPIESTKVSVCEPADHTPSRSAATPQNYGTKPFSPIESTKPPSRNVASTRARRTIDPHPRRTYPVETVTTPC